MSGVGDTPRITITPHEGRDFWCNGAWVGRLKKYMTLEMTEKCVSWELGYNICTRLLGDDMVLLIGLTEDKANQLIKSETEGGSSLFYSLEKWRPGCRPINRAVWIQIWGFPIEVWDVQNMKRVISFIGDVIEADEDTEDRHRLDRARLLVRTPLPPAIMKEVMVSCGDEEDRVRLIKEISDGGHASRTRNPLAGEWTDEITSEEDGDAGEDEDDDTSFSYSPELSSAKNRLPSDHQVPVLPNGSSDQAPDHPHLLGNNPQVQNYTEKSAEAGNASLGYFSAKVNPGYCCAEKAQGIASSEVITSDSDRPAPYQSDADQIGNFLNPAQDPKKIDNHAGVYSGCATAKGPQQANPSLQTKKLIGPSHNPGPIKNTEGYKYEFQPVLAQSTKRDSGLFLKVYVRQRHGLAKACLLELEPEQANSSKEDNTMGGLNDASSEGPNTTKLQAVEGTINQEENQFEDCEEAKQQWILAKSMGLNHESDPEGIHSFSAMESRDRREALKMENRYIQR